MPSSKKPKRDAFLAFAEGLPPLPTSVMAAAEPPRAASPDVRRAAELMVGAVDRGRVARVAAHLDELVQLDQQAQVPSRKRRARS
jgi:hypothetical protein